MRSGSDTYGPRRSHLVINCLGLKIVIEDLDASIASISDVNVSLGIGRHGVRKVELAGLGTLGPNGRDVSSVLVVLHYARVAITIGHEYISARIPSHVGRPVKCVRLGRGRRRSETGSDRDPENRFRPVTQNHDNASLRIEL